MNIEHLVIPNAGQQFEGTHFRDLLKPGVYVLLKGDRPLYIGVAKRLLQRLGGAQSHEGRTHAMNECDKVLIYPCVSIEAAYELEKVLIGHIQPTHNKRSRLYWKQQAIGADPTKRYICR